MLLNELLDMDQLCLDIEGGYVTMRTHPTNPDLHILNYADVCQYEPYWTDITRKTRGLIYNSKTLEVVARPFEKFFNYGQEDLSWLNPDAVVIGGFDKLDGSLGIAYWDGNNYAIATRGSFESEQAIHATRWLHKVENADISWMVEHKMQNGRTPLFEIIYPENRIVVDYGDMDKLVYLGSVEMKTGDFTPNPEIAVGPQDPTLRELLDLPDRANAEGIVIWVNPQYALKLKQEDYVALHKIVTGLSQKEIWRQLRAGTYDDFVKQIPDEFYDWADSTMADLVSQFFDMMNTADVYWDEVLFHNYETRKEQAMHVTKNVPEEFRGMVFSLLDGRDISDGIWKKLEPVGANPMRMNSE